jgi:sulfur carrier protein ThiS
MSATTIAKPCTGVTLLGAGGGAQTITVPDGATLADLLRQAGVADRSPYLLIDGRFIEEALVLRSGMTITIMPEPSQARPGKDWRRTVGMRTDDLTFEEADAAGRAYREADRKATLEQLDAEQEGS